MKVLLIGGTGVLSSAVTAECQQRGYKITMINRGRRKIPEGVDLIISNNKDYEAIAKALNGRRFDAVIDFLCYNANDLRDSFSLYSSVTSQYFFISSCAVYDTTVGGIYTEDSPKVRKEWPYSVEKWAAEELLEKMAAESSCSYTIIRPCLTYGDTRLPYGIAPEFRKHWTLVARILAGKPIIRWNHGTNRWNMMRVEDFAVGIVGLIGNRTAFGEAFNICGDEMPSYGDVLESISKCIGKPVITVDIDSSFYAAEMPERLAGELIGGRSADLTCDNSKIKTFVPEFKQHIFLDDGIAKTINAYQEQNFQLGIDWKFDANTDRIIEKWNRFTGYRSNYCLSFIDYLGSASRGDRSAYFQERYKGTLRLKMYGILRRIYQKIKTSFKDDVQ